MIKIKSKLRGDFPIILNINGENKITLEADKNNKLYDSNPFDYDNRIKKWEIDTSIYGHPLIKDKLKLSQHGKCAFCEGNITNLAYGDVEHFRPKKYWKQNEKLGEEGPGYYWLAYDYNNLLLACQICNQKHKKNHFPIRRPEFRAKNHHFAMNLSKEKPFYINPVTENPRLLIKFNKAEAVPNGKDKNKRGKKTIESFGLNRKGDKGISDLYEMRLQHYKTAEYIYWTANQKAIANLTQDMIDEASILMKELRSSKSQFSAMINDNYPI